MTDVIVYEQKSAQTRIALLDDGEMRGLEIIDENKAAEGNIYLGRITKKIDLVHDKTGFFVDINDGRDAFLNAEESGLDESKVSEGQSLVVQVAQERRAEKGARLSRALQFVGEYIVYHPYKMYVGASSRIEDKQKLEEYKRQVVEHTTGQEGWVLRTAAVTVPFAEIAAEMEKLRNDFEGVLKKARQAAAPSLLYSKGNPLGDYISRYKNTLQKVVTNSRNVEADIKAKFGDEVAVEIVSEPFAEYGLEDAIWEALHRQVNLPGGGSITIEETRACVAIDVDSGDDKGHGGISRLNNEAAAEIAKLIKLRNLSGKIIIDFAGSSEYRFIKPVIEILEQALADDYSRSTVLGLSRAGTVEIVRVRRHPSLQDMLTVECECCQGTGRVNR